MELSIVDESGSLIDIIYFFTEFHWDNISAYVALLNKKCANSFS